MWAKVFFIMYEIRLGKWVGTFAIIVPSGSTISLKLLFKKTRGATCFILRMLSFEHVFVTISELRKSSEKIPENGMEFYMGEVIFPGNGTVGRSYNQVQEPTNNKLSLFLLSNHRNYLIPLLTFECVYF